MSFAQRGIQLKQFVAQLHHLGKRLAVEHFAFLVVYAQRLAFLVGQAIYHDQPAVFKELSVHARQDAAQVVLGHIKTARLANDAAIHSAVAELHGIVIRHLCHPEELHLLCIRAILHDLRHCLRRILHRLGHGARRRLTRDLRHLFFGIEFLCNGFLLHRHFVRRNFKGRSVFRRAHDALRTDLALLLNDLRGLLRRALGRLLAHRFISFQNDGIQLPT